MRSPMILAASLGLLLAGCDFSAPVGKDTAVDAGAEMDRSSKLIAYANLMSDYRALSGFDPVADLKRYEEYDVPHARPDVKVALFPRNVDLAIADLRQARGQPGALPNMDAAADRAIAAWSRLLERLRGLDSYYATRDSVADELARGRREHPQLVADYKAAIAAAVPLRAAYETARDESLEKAAAFYEREKRSAQLYDVRMVQKAATLVRIIDTPAAAEDAARIGRAERIVAELLDLVRQGREARARLDRSPETSSVLDNGVPENLEEMIGGYRDLRRTPDQHHSDEMMRSYQGAMNTVSMT